jgi:hypothetical protein
MLDAVVRISSKLSKDEIGLSNATAIESGAIKAPAIESTQSRRNANSRKYCFPD